MSGRRRIGCSRRRVSIRRSRWGVNGDALREESVGSHRDRLLV